MRYSLVAVMLALCVSACVTPAQMHTTDQLNTVALGCGLALGELIQDASERKLLLLVRDKPSARQRSCVTRWARKNGLKPVFLNINFPAA